MIEIGFIEVLDEGELIGDALEFLVLGVGGYSNWKFMVLVLGEGLKGVVLGGFYQFA